MAVHFDPLNRAAIELRSDIWLGKPYERPRGPRAADAAPAESAGGPVHARLADRRPGASAAGAARAAAPARIPACPAGTAIWCDRGCCNEAAT